MKFSPHSLFLESLGRPQVSGGVRYVMALFFLVCVFFFFPPEQVGDVTWTRSLFPLLFSRSAIVDPLNCVLGSLPKAKLPRSGDGARGAGWEPGRQLCVPAINIWPPDNTENWMWIQIRWHRLSFPFCPVLNWGRLFLTEKLKFRFHWSTSVQVGALT